MAIRKILTDNHPVLRATTVEVKNINSGVQRLIDDMVETLADAGGVGLAANQVGVSKRIIIAKSGDEQCLVLINPVLKKQEGEEIDLEGCLSIPGLFGDVSRAQKVLIEALNREGKEVIIEAEGLMARVIQHELDHLNGLLFTDICLRLVELEELQDDDNCE